VLNAGNGQTLNVTFVPTDTANYATVNATTTINVVNSTISARKIFYNNSKWDGNLTAINASDDAAIATDKQALLPGPAGTPNKAAFANYTSYSKGINGIMIDVSKLPNNGSGITANDFVFRVGNTLTPSGWSAPNVSPTIQVRTNVGGVDRIEITFPDYNPATGLGIAKQWLQVTLLADANTGLAANDVSYFGNAIGEAGNNPANANVDVNDELLARNNQTATATLINAYDYDRNGIVDLNDDTLAHSNMTGFITALKLISV
jgi:hypothetical protein